MTQILYLFHTNDEFIFAYKPNKNLYGVHPMYLNIEDDDANSNVVVLVNSNAQGKSEIHSVK